MSAAPSRLGMGLVLGLGLALFGCGDEEGKDSAGDASISDSLDSQEADAVTYAGPDSWEGTNGNDTIVNDDGPGESTTTSDGTTTTDGTTATDGTTDGTTTAETNADSQEADAVTYAGPDESSSTTGG